MKKPVKFISLILAFVLACAFIPGCTFVKYDKEKDFSETVVAKLSSYEIYDPAVSEAERDEGKGVYKTEEYKMYKYQLSNLVNQYYYYIAQGAVDVDYFIQMTLTDRIATNSAYAYLDFGHIVWSQYEENQVTEAKYAAVDEYIESQISEIYSDRGETYVAPTVNDDSSSSSTSTTYPTYTDDSWTGEKALSKDALLAECIRLGAIRAEDAEDYSDASKYELINVLHNVYKSESGYYGVTDDEIKAELKEKLSLTDADLQGLTRYQLIIKLDRYYFDSNRSRVYEVSASRIPGKSGSEERRSLERKAMERTLSALKETTDAIPVLRGDEKKRMEDAWKAIDEAKKNGGISATYTALADSFVIEYLVGRSQREQILVKLLQEYIESTVAVTEEEISSYYANLLQTQRNSFATVSEFTSAASSGNLIVYFPASTGYFFIKHILIPFSEAQTKQISDYKSSALNVSQEDVTAYRNSLASQIKSYAHIDGENSGDELTVAQIVEEINRTVAQTSDRNKVKEFTKLMYKYSTDTSGFGQIYGYSETVEETANETYVAEFAKAARELYATGKVGAISGEVVTDYGVHILMLSALADEERVVGLDEYAAASDNRTVKQQIEDIIYNDKLDDIYSKWSQENIRANYLDSVTVYNSAFAKIVEEMQSK